MNGLNAILGKASHLRVLRVLNRGNGPLTGREIQRRCGLSNRAVMTALEELVAQRAVLMEATPSRYLFEPNTKHYLWSKAVRPALEAEERFWEDLRKLVRRTFKPRPEAAMVTGRIARDDTAETGTLDLHLLFESGRQRLQAYRCLDRMREQADLRYAMEVEVTFMDMRNMDDPEFLELWKRIAREGVLLFGRLP